MGGWLLLVWLLTDLVGGAFPRIQVVFCVCDEADPLETFYFGTAEIPLAPLALNRRISGQFPLIVRFGIRFYSLCSGVCCERACESSEAERSVVLGDLIHTEVMFAWWLLAGHARP